MIKIKAIFGLHTSDTKERLVLIKGEKITSIVEADTKRGGTLTEISVEPDANFPEGKISTRASFLEVSTQYDAWLQSKIK